VFGTFLFWFLGFFFFEDRAAGDTVGLCHFADFVLFRVDQAGGQRAALVFTELGAVAAFCFLGFRLSVFHRFDFFFIELGDVLRFGLGLFAYSFRGFRTGSRQEPARKGTARAARRRSCAGNHCAAARLNVFGDVWLRLVDVFLDGRYGCGCHRAIAELCERFAGEKNFVFDRTGWTRGRGGLAVTAAFRAVTAEFTSRTALVESAAITARLEAAIVAFAALRRGVFRRRKIPAADRRSGTTTPTTATSAAPTTTAAIATTVSAAISTATAIEITAASAALRRTSGVTGRGLELRRVVLWREILGRRFVRIGLALVVKLFGVLGVAWGGVFAGCVNFFDVRADVVIFGVRVFAMLRDYG
jgi:hypothetical protein